jgi:preprotein translocase subunit SecF
MIIVERGFKMSLDMIIGTILGMVSSPLMMKGIALIRRRKLDKMLHEIAEMNKKIISPYEKEEVHIEKNI